MLKDQDAQRSKLVPFLKWVGGKRWLTAKHISFFDVNFTRYIEPFLGSGSVFFKLKPRNAILSDANAELVECYTAIKKNHTEIQKLLAEHHKEHCTEHYYKIRSLKPINPYERAARFLYLNRTCFNGIYRVNLKGEFNVPIGTKSAVVLPSDNFPEISELLSYTTLKCCDFEDTINEARSGDLVYVDPPYTANHNYNGFLKYNEKIFSWNDQIRLKDCVVAAADRGAKVVISNAAHHSIKDLYEGHGKTFLIDRSSVLAANPKNRKTVEEIVVVL